MYKISIIFGTRPEAIKSAMVIKAFYERNDVELSVCFTGQHIEMVTPLIDFFGLTVNESLDLMQQNQTLAGLTAKSMDAIDAYLSRVNPDIVFVQGDTTTAMCAAIAAFYRNIKIGHIEAGLRTNDINSPFPEEFNRVVISKITNLHFAPTQRAKLNLITENVNSSDIFVTGNTVIDALLFTQEKNIKNNINHKIFDSPWSLTDKPYILITGHRRENFGSGFEEMCSAIKELAGRFSHINFIYPVHLNPNVQKPVNDILSDQENVYLVPPLDYVNFTALLADCYFVLTDSGGVQEEAPSFGKPVLVMRNSTERQEAIDAGTALLVGTNKEKIISAASRLVEDREAYQQMSTAQNPFGIGEAAKLIVKHTIHHLSGE